MKKYSAKEVIKQYNKYYDTNVKRFDFKGEEELEEIILEIFELDEDDYYVEVYENYSVETYKR